MSKDMELLKRLIARGESDINRAVPFTVGMKNFSDFVLKAMQILENKIAQLESLEKTQGDQ